MKKILKGFIFLGLINLALMVGFFGFATCNIVSKSFDGTGIKLIDFVTDSVSQEQYDLIQKKMEQNSSELGKSTAKKFESFFSVFVPKPIDVSKMPQVPYPYTPPSTVVDQNNKIAEDGFKQGLEILKQSEAANEAAKKQGLSLTNKTN